MWNSRPDLRSFTSLPTTPCRRGVTPVTSVVCDGCVTLGNTVSLLSAIPIPDPEIERKRTSILLQGDLPSPANPPHACRFHTRCPYVQPTRCEEEEPELRPLEGHLVKCHYAEEIKAGQLQPKQREVVFEVGTVPKAWEPPPV